MTKKIYKCFVASPGDTQQERTICEKVFDEINRGIGDKLGFIVEKVMWEYNSRPAFGEYSQAIISEQLGSDYNIFIGIMFKKFGTQTKNAGSGTEEEFENAYQKKIKGEPIEIMFYFNDEAVKISETSLEDLHKVQVFKNKIAELGGYYWNYNGVSEFETSLRNHLTDLLLKLNPHAKNNNIDNLKYESLKQKFNDLFEKSLQAFNGQPIIWVDPILSNSNEISQNPDENYIKRYSVENLLIDTVSTIIKAPPQFGLTCLGRYLIKKAWEKQNLWIFLDNKKVKPHTIQNAVKNEAESLGFKISDIKCIILDSWNNYETDSFKKLKNLCEAYENIPIIVLHTIDDAKFLDNDEITINRSFEILNLLALPRTQIRKVVSEYNKVKEIGMEDAVLTKVVSDLNTLNIHRTPLNCLTLLKVSEKYFDESPVNRTNMLEMVLFVLFNMDAIPTYKSKPDLKDCEYVLGRFCEKLIKEDIYYFSRESFLKELSVFCKEKLIDLEIDVVFDVLIANNIIIKQEFNFIFRSSYWIYYFAAKRMHNNLAFAEYIFSTKKYIVFPEIIEFYTGIDRSRSDALKILTKDIEETCNQVSMKVRLPENMNPFEHIQWRPTEEQINKVQNEISENVFNSGLPDSIKDQHADRDYNQIKPYNQSIGTFFEEYSLYNLMQNIVASSRALRNSDYVEPEIKKNILNQILRSWDQISKVLLALTPVLAEKGRAEFGGQAFVLDDNFGDTPEERVNTIIQANLTNVVGFFKDDLFSNKIGPLLYDRFNNETDSSKKHQLALLLIYTRPRDWKKNIENYIISIHKNSFFLFDIVNALRAKYRFDFASNEELKDMSYLIKMCFAKHEFGSKKPGLHEIIKISNKALPQRENEQEEEE